MKSPGESSLNASAVHIDVVNFMRNRALHRKRQPLSGWNAPHNHLQLKHVTVVIDANQKEISPLGLNVPYAVFLQLML